MRRFALVIAALIGLLPAPLQAGPFQPVEIMCGIPAAPCTDANPLPTTATVASGTFDSAIVGIAALPTLVAGTVVPRGSLAGAAYVQPVFGSTAGGGTQVSSAAGLPVNIVAGSAGPYPLGATAITASGTGTTAATAATLAGTSGKTTYICGFAIGADATAATAVAATVAGTITATMNYRQGVGLTPAVVALNQTFSPCVPASATNTGIVVTSGAAGSGGNTSVSAWGFQL